MKKIIWTGILLLAGIFYLFSQQTSVQTTYLPEQILRKAYEYMGTPYRYGGITQDGVDCSGMVYAVYYEITGISLPRMVGALYNSHTKVTGMLLPGDLVFFNTTGGASHVGIYIGGTNFIHAASAGPRTGVIVSSLSEKYYEQRYIGARRIVEEAPPEITIELGKTGKIKELTGILPIKWPLTVTVKNIQDEGESFQYTILKDNKIYVQQSIQISESSSKSIRIILPVEGNWYIRIQGPNTKEIAEISVVVAEGYKR